METEPTPLATLHLRDGSSTQLSFSDNFPRDCVLVYVVPGTEERGEFYTLEAPGLLSAVCDLGNIDRSEFEPSP